MLSLTCELNYYPFHFCVASKRIILHHFSFHDEAVQFFLGFDKWKLQMIFYCSTSAKNLEVNGGFLMAGLILEKVSNMSFFWGL